MIAGGGTGGHLFPALGIARALRDARPEVSIEFVGSVFGIEARILPAAGEVFHGLSIRGLQRDFSLSGIGRNLLFPWRLAAAYFGARRHVRNFDPQVVVGPGGYASAMPLVAAQRRGIPTLLQEQNSYPGLVTRKLAHKAALVCLTYEQTARHLSSDNWKVTGNPVPFDPAGLSPADARKSLGLPADGPVIFILGGSQGSKPLNDHFCSVWKTYTADLGAHLLWQTGPRHLPDVEAAVGQPDGVTLRPFIDGMAVAYTAADLVISRAGAMTLSELALMSKPAVLIPFPGAAADHQTHNAGLLADHGAARLVPQSDLAGGSLEELVRELLADRVALQQMSLKSGELARPEAGRIIANEIIKLAAA